MLIGAEEEWELKPAAEIDYDFDDEERKRVKFDEAQSHRSF